MSWKLVIDMKIDSCLFKKRTKYTRKAMILKPIREIVRLVFESKVLCEVLWVKLLLRCQTKNNS